MKSESLLEKTIGNYSASVEIEQVENTKLREDKQINNINRNHNRNITLVKKTKRDNGNRHLMWANCTLSHLNQRQ